ncbi:MAG: hypothetical protein C4543_05535 [Ignavibacteriales bacterium]|jgi:hypothetical protein|nr:MAG: hypothetical protein C4543_05535 [Ignavibacteriales bacterium]
MLTEFRKSIQSIMYERITSPFSGAFFFSWVVWNWKLIYFLIFADIEVIERIQFVELYYINIYNSLVYPLLSTTFLIILFPFITTGAFWIWLRFKNWQNEIKNEIEKKQLLTIEKSIQLRMELRNQEDNYNKILTSKEEEINLLKKEIDELHKRIEGNSNSEINSNVPASDLIAETFNYDESFIEFSESDYFRYFESLIESIQSGKYLPEHFAPLTLAYFESNDIISGNEKSDYRFTEKGRYFVKKFLNSMHRL